LVDDDESVVLPETSHTLSHAQHLGNGHVRLRGARPELGIAYVGNDVAEDLSFDSDIRPFAQRKQLQILLDGLERDLDGHPSEVPVQHIVGILLYVGEEHEESVLVRPPGLLLVRQGFELLSVLRTGQPFAETICRVVLVEVDVCVDPLVEDSDLSPDSEIMMTLPGEGILPVAEQVLRAFVELFERIPAFRGHPGDHRLTALADGLLYIEDLDHLPAHIARIQDEGFQHDSQRLLDILHLLPERGEVQTVPGDDLEPYRESCGRVDDEGQTRHHAHRIHAVAA